MNFIGSFVCCSGDHHHDDEGEMSFLQELGFGDNNSRLGSDDSLHWNIDRSKVYSLHHCVSTSALANNQGSILSNNLNNNHNNINSNGEIMAGMSEIFRFNPLLRESTASNPIVRGGEGEEGSRMEKPLEHATTGMGGVLNTSSINNTVTGYEDQDRCHRIAISDEGVLPVLMDDEEKALIERSIEEEVFDDSVSSSAHDLDMYDQLSVDHFWSAVSYDVLGGDRLGVSEGDELAALREIDGMIASATDPVGKV